MAELPREGVGGRSWRRGLVAAGAMSVLLALLLPAAAAPSGEKKLRHDTFAGSCEFAATVRFSPPLSAREQATHAEALASGPCSGTWRSHRGTWRLDGDDVLYKARSEGMQSCAAAEVSGIGALKYRGRTLRFSSYENRVGATASLRLEGTRGGLFEASAAAEGDPVEVVRRCFTDGIGEAAATITGASEPKISG